MFTLNAKDLYAQAAISSDDGNTLITEASTIGLAPGQWPDFIAVGETTNDGKSFEGTLLMRDSSPDSFGSFTYRDKTQTINLFVIND